MYKHLLILISGLFLLSCSAQKNHLAYFTDLQKDSVNTQVIGESDFDIKIAPDDELMITVNSVIPEATAIFNLPLANPSAMPSLPAQTQPQQQTFMVNNEGYINFPVLGKIHVQGKTTEQISEELAGLIEKYADNPYVRVEIINFKVNVMGEVKAPCTINVKRSRFSILDAISTAGDLTDYGLRENVMVIREIGGQKVVQRLDLNDSKITSSPFFYLKQNDVIYVEPNKIKKDNSKYNQFNAYKLSVISTVVSAASVIASLVIALTIK